jgi:hypothetical protein
MSSCRFVPHPANRSGDFYVVDQCCITCGIPLQRAPEVFAWVTDGRGRSCIVARQPSTPSAIANTLRAIHDGEADCIRYRGSDPDIIRRLIELGEGAQADRAPFPEAGP